MLDRAFAAGRQAVLDRLTLLINHVLASEPQAAQRLRPHAGRTLEAEIIDAPSLLPRPAPVRWSITRAGLLELEDAPVAGDGARVRVRVREPAGWLDALPSGMRPPIEIVADEPLASDLEWVLVHVRWDIADDLASLVGDVLAHQIARFASSGVQTLRRFVRP